MSNPNSVRRLLAAGTPPAIAALVFLMLAAVIQPRTAHANSKYASIVIDQNTGRVLYARHADDKRYPASLTKIMTLYLLFEQMRAGKVDLDTRFEVSEYAASKPPSKLGLKPGQTIRVQDAIRSLVTKSANDIATVIAENLGGSEAKFARLMTLKAHELGMDNTIYRNASGLPNEAQVTTARDIATLSRRIRVDFPEYYGYFSLKYFSYHGKRYRNHNGLLFSYKGTDGVKTGYTHASGFNLAASVHRGNKHLVAVVMGGQSSKSRNQHISYLLNKSWNDASSRRQLVPNRKAPLPARNPLTRDSVPVASIPQTHSAAVVSASAIMGAPGIMLDRSDPRRMLNGREHEREPARATPQRSGDYHVQVGAYTRQSEAVDQLNAVRARAANVVDGHTPITMPVPTPKRNLYRARFAGFTEDAAHSTCSQLIERKIPCIVMRAQ